MPNQPSNFGTKANAIPETDFDRMSSAQISQLINGAGKILNKGRPGQLGTLPKPPAPRVVDLSQYLGGLNV